MSSAVNSPKVRFTKLALTAGSLLLSGYLVLRGFQALAGASAPAPEGASDSAPTRRVSRASAPPAIGEIARTILERNIFDSATGPIAWQDAPAALPEPQGQPASPQPSDVIPCPEGIRLLAAVVFEKEPERSFGVLRSGDVTRQLRVGVPQENTTLVALAPTYAHVRDPNGSTCRVPLFGAGAATPVAPAPAPTPEPQAPAKDKKKAGKSPFSPTELDAGITSLGGDRYRIRRELLTRAMADAAGVVRGSKFIPQTGGVRNPGVKITRVANNSVLHKLGVRSGDILRTLNGVDLSRPDGMLSAYALLREQSTLTLSLTRGGSAKNLQYTIE